MSTLVWEILYMSLLIFALAFVLHFVAYLKGMGDDNDEIHTTALKKIAKARKTKWKTGNTFIDKWLEFGGGYYGIVAFVKFILIELAQIKDFLFDGPSIGEFIQSLGIGTLINLFVEQIMNFVAAIIWPTDLLGRYPILQIAIFIGITYLAYDAARKLARRRINRMFMRD